MSMINVRLTTTLKGRPSKQAETTIFAPAAADFPQDLAPEALALPICDTNGITASYLKNQSSSVPDNCYCGIFVLDPFLNWSKFAQMLRVAKFKGICNFPPLPEFGEEEERALAASEYTFENEIMRISDFASEEFDLLIVCSTSESLESARNKLHGDAARFCLLSNISIANS